MFCGRGGEEDEVGGSGERGEGRGERGRGEKGERDVFEVCYKVIRRTCVGKGGTLYEVF